MGGCSQSSRDRSKFEELCKLVTTIPEDDAANELAENIEFP